MWGCPLLRVSVDKFAVLRRVVTYLCGLGHIGDNYGDVFMHLYMYRDASVSEQLAHKYIPTPLRGLAEVRNRTMMDLVCFADG